MGEAVAKLSPDAKASKGIDPKGLRSYIFSRRTSELVIAFCGAVGSGVSTVAQEFKKLMEDSRYGYRLERIKVSDLIEKAEPYLSDPVPEFMWPQATPNPRAKRTARLQDLGDALRYQFSYDALAVLAISEISIKRAQGHLTEQVKEKIIKGEELPNENVRTIWLVDSLKNPEEVKTLRSIYGSMFYLIGVLSPFDVREGRLRKKGMSTSEAGIILDRDASGSFDHGQKLVDTIHMADFFVNNAWETTANVTASLQRFISILFGQLVPPTKEEYAMYVAQSAAYNSACLSRQVGAAVMAEDGNIISYGYNDVPKCGGGLYCSGDGPDNRCYATPEKCRSESEKDTIKEKIKTILSSSSLKNEDVDAVLAVIYKESGIKNLTEFSKAVHAEMDAIIKVARRGTGGIEGCKMFVTTYPCHNCAKHIVAAGIKSVVYIEPYEKSLALKLHDDSITSNPAAGEGKVKFIPFDGVAPRQFQNFFVIHGERKEKEEVLRTPPNEVFPISDKFRDSFQFYEAKAIQSLMETPLSGILQPEQGDKK